MRKYLLASVLILLGSCEAPALFKTIEDAVKVVDNSLSNSIRVSNIARVGNNLYLGSIVLRQRQDDLSWRVISGPIAESDDDPGVDLAANNNVLWFASYNNIYRYDGNWTLSVAGQFRFGDTFFSANGVLVIFDGQRGSRWLNNNTWQDIPVVAGDLRGIAHDGSNYWLITSTGLYSGSDLANLSVVTGPPEKQANYSDIIFFASKMLVVANYKLYSYQSNSWSMLAENYARVVAIDQQLLLYSGVPGYAVWDDATGKLLSSKSSDGFTNYDSLRVKAGDLGVDSSYIAKIYFDDRPDATADRLYALAEGANGVFVAQRDKGKWSWERE